MKKNCLLPCKQGERGAAIVESVFTMLVILLVLFGLMQLFQLAMANVVGEYAAFRAARSGAVGFRDYLADREGKVKSIPASGQMTLPRRMTTIGNVAYEQAAVRDYMKGDTYLSYSCWDGGEVLHNDYNCPLYGQPVGSGGTGRVTGCYCQVSAGGASVLASGKRSEKKFTFRNYPVNMPLFDLTISGRNIDIESQKVKLTDHADVYLE